MSQRNQEGLPRKIGTGMPHQRFLMLHNPRSTFLLRTRDRTFEHLVTARRLRLTTHRQDHHLKKIQPRRPIGKSSSTSRTPNKTMKFGIRNGGCFAFLTLPRVCHPCVDVDMTGPRDSMGYNHFIFLPTAWQTLRYCYRSFVIYASY